MPKTFATTVSPLPDDPRVMSLSKSVGITRREAFAAVVEVWHWLDKYARNDIVYDTGLDSLDSVSEIEGFGQAMLQAGLVGTVDGGLVLPAELRHSERDGRGGGHASRPTSKGAIRQKRLRDRKRLKVSAPRRATTTPNAEAPRPTHKPRCLGTVEGCSVMLLFSPKTECFFYKLDGAMPADVTGTVTNQENPSFADALMSLHSAMKRKAAKGLDSADKFRPTMEQMVAAAERERDSLKAAAAEAVHREQANQALAEAAAEDQDDVLEVARKRNGSVTGDARNVTPVTGDALRDVSRNAETQSTANGETACDDSQRNAFRDASAPSSSSSFSSSANEERKRNTTTTSEDVAVVREAERLDQFLERLKPPKPAPIPEDPKQQDKYRKMAERFAAALGITVDEVFRLWRTDKPGLRARLEAAGIDPTTGLAINADGAGKPVQARDDIDTTSDTTTDDKPATGIVDAPGDDCRQPDSHEDLSKVDRLEQSCTTLLVPGGLGAEPFWMKTTGDIDNAEPATAVAPGA
jgi:hypothetical protein